MLDVNVVSASHSALLFKFNVAVVAIDVGKVNFFLQFAQILDKKKKFT